MALIDAVAHRAWELPAQRLWRLTGLRTNSLKTQCNNHPTPVRGNKFQACVLLHGMQGVSGSNPLGSILLGSLRRKGFFVA